MLDLVKIVNIILALGVIASQIFIVLAVFYIIFSFGKKSVISDFFAKNSIKFAFVVALIATLGSLFYSNYAGFVPCVLCWFQRIFMYPEAIILGLSLLKKDRKIVSYALLLSLVGLVISIYHNYIYFNGLHTTVCTTAESCITPYVTEFGYITIPMMALTAFALISLLLIFTAFYEKQRQQA